MTPKITIAACEIANGKQQKLTSAKLDWGWAPEYAEAMYQILQHNERDSYTIATGAITSLHEFIAESVDHFMLKLARPYGN